jgi:RNA polymerase sigma-70 factor, ECF subfamily
VETERAVRAVRAVNNLGEVRPGRSPYDAQGREHANLGSSRDQCPEGMSSMDAVLQTRPRDLGYALAEIRSLMWTGRSDKSRSQTDPPGAARTGGESDSLPDDAALVERSKVDAEAFGLLYDRYCDRIYRYVHRRLHDHEAAEDVTAEIFMKALKAVDTYRPAIAPFSAWLYRIASNAVIDHARARRITISLGVTPDAADLAAPVDELVLNRVEAERVWRVVDQLGPAQRMAILLRYGRDLPIADIAQRMGRTNGAVKLLLNRGLAAVRTALDADPQVLEDGP